MLAEHVGRIPDRSGECVVSPVSKGKMMSSYHSYPSIFAMGHRAIADLLKGDIIAEEKVDGSQFSFGVFAYENEDGVVASDVPLELKIRSKGAVMIPDAPEKMFTKAAESVKERVHLLHPDWTYRGEYLAKPKHNALAYDRVPIGHIIIFDVNTGEEAYLDYEAKKAEAERIGLEVVPKLYEGRLDTIEQFRQFLGTTSILGGQAIEGVVVKPVGYGLYGRDKKCLMGKFVSEAYKEVHSKAWRHDNPSAKDIIAMLGDAYGTQARWNKAIMHLRERGEIEDDVRDIGKVMKEIPVDVLKECEEEIKDKLFAYAFPHIRRMVTRNFPQYYKDLLLRSQFERTGVEVEDGVHSPGDSVRDSGLPELAGEGALSESPGSSD